MKIKALFAVALLVPGLAFADPSQTDQDTTAPDSWYVKAEAGLSMPNSVKVTGTGQNSAFKLKMKQNGLVVGLCAGYAFSEFLRTDLMFGYRKLKSKSDRGATSAFNARSVMASGYVDAANSTIFTPYVMAGLGATRTQIKGTDANSSQPTVDKTKTSLAWTTGAGCRAKVMKQVDVDLVYRITSLGKYTVKDRNGTTLKIKNISSNEMLAGIVFRF